MTTLKVEQIQKLNDRLVRMMNSDAPLREITKLQKYIIREENLIIKKQNRFIKTLERENKKLKKQADRVIMKVEKKAERLRLKEEKKNKKQFYHINAYVYVESDKILNDETGEYEYKTPYDYKNPNIYQSIGETRIENRKHINTTIEKKYIDKFDENILYFCLVDRVDNQVIEREKNVENYKVIKDYIEALQRTDEEIDHSIDVIKKSKDIIAFKIVMKELINDNYVPPIIQIDHLNNEGRFSGINNKYTEYKLNLQANNFGDLLQINYIPYIQKNYHPKSCLLTNIIQCFYDDFNQTKSDGVRRYKELTYKRLSTILELEYKPNGDIGTNCLHVIEKFFKKYDYSFYLYDAFMRLHLKHDATSTSRKCMRVLVKDGHAYLLNNKSKLKSLQQMKQNENDETIIKISDKYNIMKPKEEVTQIFCVEKEDIINAFKKYANDDTVKHVKIVSGFPLDLLLFYSVFNSEYTPNVRYSVNIDQIDYFINDTLFSIIPNNMDSNNVSVHFTNIDEYKRYNKVYEKFYNSIISKDNISEHHPSALIFESYYRIRPISGYFGEYNHSSYTALDMNKCYSKCI